jgi:Ca-activated chloride channel family protein
MLSDFHFLAPEWLLALLPLGVILWGIGRRGTGAGAWRRVVDPRLLPHLLVSVGGIGRWLPLALLAAGWLGAVLALANPAFERLPVPVYRGELARVVILDLSRSMETPDLNPSRLARARYKVADILERSREGQTGLIVFSGDAFVVSPLTDDADTILAMLEAVVPEIMPVQGSRPDLAIERAGELLARAGASGGEVVLLGDDAGGDRALGQARTLASTGHSLSVIGVGTEEGAPVPGALDADGRPVVSRLDADSLKALAAAGGGAFAPLSADASDLDRALLASADVPGPASGEEATETEVWRELGPWVLLAVLPLGALAFRRGWLLGLAVLLTGNLALAPRPVVALSWDDLWQRRDQQAAGALERGDYERVLELADQARQRGAASYRLGDFEGAAEAFATVDQAEGQYNLGNALARAGRLEEAIAAYQRALDGDPDMEDAAHNKALVEELLEQQREQEQRQQGQGEGQADQQGEEPEDGQSDGSPGADQASAGQSQPGQQDEQPAGGGQEDPADWQSEAGREQGAGQQGQESEAGKTQSAQDPAQAGGSPRAAPDQSDASATESPAGDEADSAQPQDSEEAERAAAEYREQAAAHRETQSRGPAAPAANEPNMAEPSAEEREERQAADQWLRRIPDDPAGLLRRKFLYQYRARAAQEGAVASGDPW